MAGGYSAGKGPLPLYLSLESAPSKCELRERIHTRASTPINVLHIPACCTLKPAPHNAHLHGRRDCRSGRCCCSAAAATSVNSDDGPLNCRAENVATGNAITTNEIPLPSSWHSETFPHNFLQSTPHKARPPVCLAPPVWATHICELLSTAPTAKDTHKHTRTRIQARIMQCQSNGDIRTTCTATSPAKKKCFQRALYGNHTCIFYMNITHMHAEAATAATGRHLSGVVFLKWGKQMEARRQT